MKNARSSILCIVLAACATAIPAHRPELDGAWQSSRELTLQELRRVPELGEEQLAALSRPELFGHLIQVYDQERFVIVLDGQCASSTLKRISSTSDSLTVRYRDQTTGQDHDVTLAFRGDRLVVPIRQLGHGAGEVFTRVSLQEVTRQNPCLAAALD